MTVHTLANLDLIRLKDVVIVKITVPNDVILCMKGMVMFNAHVYQLRSRSRVQEGEC